MRAGWLQEMRFGEHKPETLEYGIGSFVYRARRPFHPARLHDWMTGTMGFSVDGLAEQPAGEDGGDEDGGDAGAAGEESEKQEEEAADGGDAAAAAAAAAADTAAAAASSSKQWAELKDRRAKAAQEYGQILRSKGFMWIVTRPWGIGEWSQAGLMGAVGCSSPWFATVPKEEWPEDEEGVAMIKADFHEPERDVDPEDLDPVTSIGDRRQEIVFIGIGIDQAKLSAKLDACLVTPEELAEHHAWGKAVNDRMAEAEASVPDSGDPAADAAAREAAVEAMEPLEDPFAAVDPFGEWPVDFMDDGQEEEEEEEEEGDAAGAIGGELD